jgi:hypothetical protein
MSFVNLHGAVACELVPVGLVEVNPASMEHHNPTSSAVASVEANEGCVWPESIAETNHRRDPPRTSIPTMYSADIPRNIAIPMTTP